nr:DEAD/DEAH box helicase [Motilibacter aurantiacus]
MVTASVQGTRPTPYRVVITPVGTRAWRAACSCPVGANCKHAAAVVLAARAEAAPPPQAPPRSAWESQLAALTRPDGAGQGRPGVPLGLQFEVVGSPPGYGAAPGAPRLRLRAVARGAKGGWVRTGTAWRDLQSAYGRSDHLPAHRRVMQEIVSASGAAPRSYYSYGPESVHADELGAALWHHLDRAVAVGVELVLGKQQRVAVGAPATVALDLRRRPDGSVSLRPVLRSGDAVVEADDVHLIGESPFGVFTTEPRVIELLAGGDGAEPPALVLSPLAERPDDRVVPLLRAGSPLRIPEDELARFFTAYYPALRRVVAVTAADGSVTPPELLPPVLALTATYSGLSVELAWAFRYRVGGEPLDVPLDATAGDSGALRDAEEEQRLLDALGPARPYVGERRLLGGMQAVEFTTRVLPGVRGLDGVDVTVVGEVPDYRQAQEAPVVSLTTADVPDSSDWFDLGVTVSVEGQQVPFDALFRALAEQRSHLVLPSGLYLPLDRPELETLRRLIDEARSLQDPAARGLRVTMAQAGLWEELLELGVVAQQSARWAAAVEGLLAVNRVVPPPDPGGFAAELRPYQREGFSWLALLWRSGLGGILADDMGLGKTVQTLALICHAREAGGLPGPFLVVAPTSVVGNWEREAARFAPGLVVRAVTETTRRRGTPLAEDVAGADLVITSYALFRIDAESYVGREWAGLVLDEAQFVKNHQAKTYQCARRLPAAFKLAVTGTPLENSLMDLWSLLSIVAPGLFPSPQRFSEEYRRPIERGEGPDLLPRLRRRVRPLMLRRTKEQVVTELPPKQEQVLEVVLDPKHQRVYQAHLQRERRKVLGLLDDVNRNRFEILRSLTLLRQLSLAPELVDAAYAGVPASKLEVFVETLQEVIGEGHRALVFSQFTGFLKLVRDRLDREGVRYSYLDGRTRKRAERIEEFKTGDAPVFLISLKAGGAGLNLTEADYCFVLDPWWNPAAEAQAVDRAHRIGQDKTVMVYRLVAAGTIEEKVMALKARKQSLFDRVVDDDAMMSAPLSAEDIRGLFA